MTRQDLLNKKAELENKLMLTELDCFGLSKYDIQNNKGVYQTTKFDGFIMSDTMRLALSDEATIEAFKEANNSRFNQERGVFIVTVGDQQTPYYDFATMLNRFRDPIYKDKVYSNVSLLNQFIAFTKAKNNDESSFGSSTI